MQFSDVRFEPAADYDGAVRRAAAGSGIDHEYWDIFHKRHEMSPEAGRKILQALGWDVASFEAIEVGRKRRFERDFASALPETVVIREAEKWVPLTLSEETG